MYVACNQREKTTCNFLYWPSNQIGLLQLPIFFRTLLNLSAIKKLSPLDNFHPTLSAFWSAYELRRKVKKKKKSIPILLMWYDSISCGMYLTTYLIRGKARNLLMGLNNIILFLFFYIIYFLYIKYKIYSIKRQRFCLRIFSLGTTSTF